MGNEEKILQLLEAQQEELRKINTRLEKLEENTEITRASVNSLLEWADHVSNAISFPLPKVE